MPFDALISLLVLVALFCLLYGPWQSACVDAARHVAFEKRAAIFDLAHQGRLDFSSSEYQTIRKSLEQSIYFAHELTWPRFLVLRSALQRQGAFDRKSALQSAIDQIGDPETRKHVEWLVFRAHLALIISMIVRSPFMLVGIPVLIMFAGCDMLLSRTTVATKRVFRATGEMLQVEAENNPRASLPGSAIMGSAR